MLSRILTATALVAAAVTVCAAAPTFDAEGVESATFSPLPDQSKTRPEPEIVKAEVMLDRAQISPGAIDGFQGDNLRDALTAYQKQSNLDPSGRLDQPTWDKLTAGAPQALVTYKITEEDAKGPFTKRIPLNFEAQSKLEHLGYHDIVEELAERFHMSRSLLRALNPRSRFRTGEDLKVANVVVPVPTEKAARIVVDKTGHDVEALAADGRLLAFYPASIGSAEKPAPSGDFTIHRIDRNPIYTYDPKYHFKGVSATKPFSIAAGPNNPVGLVWMDLGGDGYGIHGTPSPDAVGKTQSHGCIRLTNWNALNLAERVQPGTPVSFGDVPGANGPVATPALPPMPTASPGEPVAAATPPAAQPSSGPSTSPAPPAAAGARTP